MGRMGFFGAEKRYASLDAKNDPLAAIDALERFQAKRKCFIARKTHYFDES